MVCIDIIENMERFTEIEQLQKDAFPPEESYSMEQILSLARTENIKYQSFWENDTLCGITFYNVGYTMLYLFYLATPAMQRSKGYGSRLLHWLQEAYPDKVIVGNIEPVGFKGPNEEQRIRRLNFYQRNGFRQINYRLLDDSGLYDIISSKGKFNQAEYMELIDELGFGLYHPRILTL